MVDLDFNNIALQIRNIKWMCMIMHYANILNHVCCVITVCHLLRCTCWGHLGPSPRVTSHLNWYRMVCMEELACKLSRTKSMNMFPCTCIPWLPCILFEDLLWLLHEASLFSCLMFVHINVDLKHGGIFFSLRFDAISTNKNISGGYVIRQMRVQNSYKCKWFNRFKIRIHYFFY